MIIFFQLTLLRIPFTELIVSQILRYIETHDAAALNTKDFYNGGQNDLHSHCSHACSSQNRDIQHLEKICLEFVMQV